MDGAEVGFDPCCSACSPLNAEVLPPRTSHCPWIQPQVNGSRGPWGIRPRRGGRTLVGWLALRALPLRHALQQLRSDVWVLTHEHSEIPQRHRIDGDVARRGDGCCPRAVADQCDLANILAGAARDDVFAVDA